jgi:hypothetical protein
MTSSDSDTQDEEQMRLDDGGEMARLCELR